MMKADAEIRSMASMDTSVKHSGWLGRFQRVQRLRRWAWSALRQDRQNRRSVI